MHPLVEMTLYLGLSIFSLAADSIAGWFATLFIISVIVNIHSISLMIIWKKVRHLIVFYPLLLGIFILSSLVFSNETLATVLNQGGFAMLRFILVTAIIGAYLERESRKKVLISIRTAWVRMNIPLKRVEDFFLFLNLTMRFFPSIQRDWLVLNQSRAILGIKQDKKRIRQLSTAINTLPGFLLLHLKKARHTALAMSLRGYGNQIPRGVAEPVRFFSKDFIQLIAVLIMFMGIYFFAAL